MAAWVEVTQDGRRPLRVMVADRLDVGRECDGLLLADERVSRLHLRLEMVDDRLVVADLGSSNGTFLDGERVATPVPVDERSLIRLGSTSIRLAPGMNDRPVAVGAGRSTVVGPSSRPVPARLAVDPTVRRSRIDLVASAVGEERPALTGGDRGDDDTTTILFSDIEGSTELATGLGDERWYRRLSTHNRIVEGCVAQGRGFVVKNQGDGYMATFPSARQAVLAAAQIQHRLLDVDDARPLVVRIGCHTGEAIRRHDGDLVGQHVIIASRVADLARGGQVLVSSITREITAARGDLPFGEAIRVVLKGIEGTHDVYDLDWRRLGSADRPSARRSAEQDGDPSPTASATGRLAEDDG